jgi:dUTP pyrophosphatase
MMFDPIKIYKLKSDVPDLKYATEYAACMDVSAYLKFNSAIKSYTTDNKELEVLVTQDKDGKDFIDIPANWRVLVPTGMIFDLPKDVHLKVYPRSGLSTKKGLNLINCTGIIDEDYINELFIPLFNNSIEKLRIYSGDRIAQIEVCNTLRVNTVELTERPSKKGNRDGGFGSTGLSLTIS